MPDGNQTLFPSGQTSISKTSERHFLRGFMGKGALSKELHLSQITVRHLTPLRNLNLIFT